MANNEQQAEPRRNRKRIFGSDLVDSMIARIHGNQSVNTDISPSVGPIYPVDDKSLILNQKYTKR